MTNTVLWPGNRVPVTVILDDPMPCRNPMWYEQPDAGHVADVPNRFTARFADLIERTGAAGKFSVVPCPGATGRVDEGVPGVADADLAEFLHLVRERIAPRWDVSPELLTHNRALDLATMRPLPEREDAWAAHQDGATLTAYVARGLQILRNAGLQPNGVTSPWSFGREVEDAYASAIATALREVCGVRLGWYFLHLDAHAPAVPPRIMRLDPAAGSALVSIISGSAENGAGGWDFAWRTQFGEPAATDTLLTADGSAGRLVTLYRNGGPLTFHTHWQSLFSNGSGAGLDALGTLFERINRTWGGRIRWTSARELATYCVARAATRFTPSEGGRRVRLAAPFECREFTIALPRPPGATALLLDGAPLERLPDGDVRSDDGPNGQARPDDRPDGAGPLREGSWRDDGDTARACFALRDGVELVWR